MEEGDLELEKQFNSCDRNGDGSIDKFEIAKIMKLMNDNKEPTEHEVNEVFKLMDTDGNGSIDFDEFRTALRSFKNKKKKRDDYNDYGSPKAIRKKTDSNALSEFFNQYKSADEISDLHSRLMKENHIDITEEDFIISEALHYGYEVTSKAEKLSLCEQLTMWHSNPETFYTAMRHVIDSFKLPLTEGFKILEALKEVQRWLSIPRIFSTIKERFNYSRYTRQIFDNLVGLDRQYGAPEDQIHNKLLYYLKAHIIIEDTNSDTYPFAIEFVTVVLDCVREFILGIRNPNEPEDSRWHSTHYNNVRTQSSQFMLRQGVLKELSSIIDKTQFHEVNDKNVSVLIAAINCFSALMERDSEIVHECIDIFHIRTKIMTFYPQAVVLKSKSLLVSITSAISIMSGYTQNDYKKTKYFSETSELYYVIDKFMNFFILCRSNNGYNNNEFFSREVQISIINILKTISFTLPLVEFMNKTKDKYLEYIEELVFILKLKSDVFISNSIKAEISYAIMSILNELISSDGAKGETVLANLFIHNRSFMKSIRYQLTLGMDTKMDIGDVSTITLNFVNLLIKHGDKYNVAKYLGDILLLKLNSPHCRYEVIATLNSLLNTEESKDCLIKFGIVDSFFNIFMKFKTQVLSETRGETVIKLNNSYEFGQLIDIAQSLNNILDHNRSYSFFTLDNIETIGLFFIILEVEIINGNIKQNYFEDIDEIIQVIKRLFDKVVRVKSTSNDSTQIKKQCDLIYTGLVDKIKSAKEKGESRHDNEDDMELDAHSFPKLDWFYKNGVISSNDDFKCTFIVKWNPSDRLYATLPRNVNFVELVDYFTKTMCSGSSKMELQYLIPLMNDTYHTIAANEFEEYLQISIKPPPHDIVKLYIKKVDTDNKPLTSPTYLKSAAEIQREFDLNHPDLSISKNLLNELCIYFQSNNCVELNESLFCEIWKLMKGSDDEKTVADAKSLFRAFDNNKNGGLSVQEVLIGLTKLMKGTVDEKIVIAFNAYDLDGNKKLDYVELVNMIEISNYPKYNNDVAQAFSNQAYKYLKLAPGTPINFEQFRDCVIHAKVPLGTLFIDELESVKKKFDELDQKDQSKNTNNSNKNRGKKNTHQDKKDHNQKNNAGGIGKDICKQWATKKECKFGNSCRFSHQ